MREANDNELYVCGACGKTAKSIYNFKDVSCAVNAVLAYTDCITFYEDSTIATDIAEGGIVQPQPEVGS